MQYIYIYIICMQNHIITLLHILYLWNISTCGWLYNVYIYINIYIYYTIHTYYVFLRFFLHESGVGPAHPSGEIPMPVWQCGEARERVLQAIERAPQNRDIERLL